ncbi:MAG: hypothetical protein AAGA69_11660, partial [Pseudomonadota bacterium]
MTALSSALVFLGYAGLIGLLWWGGNIFCSLIIRLAERPDDPETVSIKPDDAQLAAGRVIGILERSLIAAGILTGKWEVMAAVIALKTVARYKELEQQIQAEYFLIGSLA